jgi:hypothetical protein
MQPHICYICGKSNPDDTDAEWVKFKDFTETDPGDLGSATGQEFFCGEHIHEAKKLSYLTRIEALKLLDQTYPKEQIKKTWWEKIFS